MADVNDLAQRISSALERISQSVDSISLASAPVDGDDPRVLQEELAAERQANQQLEERVSALKERQEKVVERLEAEVASLSAKSTEYLEEMEQLKFVNERLMRNNNALREANAAGLGDPDVINAGMAAELDALRVRRDTDRRELELLLAELKPLVSEDEHA